MSINIRLSLDLLGRLANWFIPNGVGSGPVTILIVEDDPAYLELMEKILITYSHRRVDVIGVKSEAAARDKIPAAQILILDWGIQSRPARETLTYWLATKGRRSPIAVISSHVDKKLERELLGIGVDNVLAKEIIDRSVMNSILDRFVRMVENEMAAQSLNRFKRVMAAVSWGLALTALNFILKDKVGIGVLETVVNLVFNLGVLF